MSLRKAKEQMQSKAENPIFHWVDGIKALPSSASIEGKSLQSETPVESVTQIFHKLE